MSDGLASKNLVRHRRKASVCVPVMNRMLELFLVFVFCLHATTAFAWTKSGTTYTTNGSQSDVASAVSAASTGDTVSIPSGTFTWSTGINISKRINIIGATSGCPSSCNDATKIIIGAITAFTPTASGFRISGITFEGISNSGGVISINAGGTNKATNWRIDHNHFKDVTGRAISVGAYASGSGYGADWPALIDSNRFSATARFKAIEAYGGSLTTHGSWDDTLTLGGSDFLFIENNYFVHSTMAEGVSSIDGDTGARYVIRYNNFTNGDISAHGVEVSIDPIIKWRSTHGWEIYENYFNSTVSHAFQLNIRGGTGVIYKNRFNGTATLFKPIRYLYERGDLYSAAGDRGCTISGSCDGSSSYDGNQSGKYGYGCYQQIGATGSAGTTSMPVYQWGNSYNGAADEDLLSEITFSGDCPYQHVQFGRDVIKNGLTPKPGYTAYTYPHPLTTAASPLPSTGGKIPMFPPINPIQ